MGIDTSKIRVGDEVTLRTTITHKSMNYLGADNWWLAVSCRDIVAHHPKSREIKVGDMVRLSGGGEPRRVLHVHEGRAWLENSGVLWSVSDLRHAD